MNPPAPGPVSSDSDANDTSTDATAASTALPPARRTSAPASAVTSMTCCDDAPHTGATLSD